MRNVRLLLTVSVALVFWYATLIDTAVVRSEEFAEQLQRIVLNGPENLRTQRAVESGNEENPKRTCYNTPCGWAVYVPFTRRVNYFMKNTCDCPDETYKCVRADDDLSVSAYVYRCRQNTTADDIESPEDAN